MMRLFSRVHKFKGFECVRWQCHNSPEETITFWKYIRYVTVNHFFLLFLSIEYSSIRSICYGYILCYLWLSYINHVLYYTHIRIYIISLCNIYTFKYVHITDKARCPKITTFCCLMTETERYTYTKKSI